MKEYKWTIIGLGCAFALWLLVAGLNLDVFEGFLSCMQRHERFEIDELVLSFMVFYIFALFDLFRKYHQSRIEAERLKVCRSMIRAMNHILNNFLQKMMLFKLTAEETEGFDPEMLKLYDTIIDEATAQIKALGCITSPDEDTILKTVVLDPSVN